MGETPCSTSSISHSNITISSENKGKIAETIQGPGARVKEDRRQEQDLIIKSTSYPMGHPPPILPWLPPWFSGAAS
jgi:hypothetical protein